MAKAGEKYKDIEPIYILIEEIQSNTYEYKGSVYTNTKGMWLAVDQWGAKHLIDINRCRFVKE
jgi:hypothetical protein